MSSIALQSTTAAPAPTFRAEEDLLRAARRGDRDAFQELCRRHGPSAWRLATAVAAERDQAGDCVAEGFVRAVRGAASRPAAAGVRGAVLAGVYRRAIETARRAGEAPAASGEDGGALETAFRSLPERWRAALWLAEVEGFDAEATGAVLGLPAAAGRQLVDRGRRGLAARMDYRGDAVPAALGTALAALTPSLPAALPERVAARWHHAISVDRATRFVPAGLRGERAPRAVGVAATG
ncbi:MAG TPA: sigma-70 family RNA polymerase sigma factor, partial [Acidimicrobiales bacterium]|nr:sigma-70 family RNA polymerase sigma factor [Acidimicrobiales bacterium]